MADPPDPGSPPPRSDDGENAADPSNSGSSCPASEEPEDFAAPDPLMQLIATARIEDLREAVRTVTRYDETARRCVTGSLADTRRVRANVEMCQTGKRKAVEVCAGCQVDFHEEENKQGRCSVYLFHPKTPVMNRVSEYWMDMYEADFEMMDMNFDENKEGYVFPCCDEDGKSEGCEPSFHIASGVVSKKAVKM